MSEETEQIQEANERLAAMIAEYEASHKDRIKRTRTTKSQQIVRTGSVGSMPTSRSVRVTPRGKAQTSYWKALRIAEDTLTVRIDESIKKPEAKVPFAERRRIEEQVVGFIYKPRKAPWLQKLDQRPFQSREQWLKEQEIAMSQMLDK